ncbi:MAG: response regulator transcription factor [Bacteroidales bacterium]|jgi:DNA-binding response OmpR family regulator|nr:response regulator transcription factor [Bacteroidales bacterium]MDD2203744.1 response regulator transcription factor [Bacteroidales bacterium]MDD3152929.1 response regulator transcription factor [Bacteroidales bacterium]MDD3913318.1 response regulator transcription factor [Bacteroidales bacterium]MDD4633349.1 response regulator transcription factor [Bacteroidales bacterium]
MKPEQLKILLAEDDPNLGRILQSYMEAKGYPAKLFVNGEEAFNAFKNEKFDFCVLDVMMPIKDGFTLAKDIRALDEKIPILFLTAKSMEEDKRIGYEIGADDYLTKPFSMDELIMKIEAISRRCNPFGATSNNQFIIGKYTFDYMKQTLEINGEVQRLTSRESDLLKLLCISKNDILDRSFALKKIWLDDSYFNARSMDVYVAKLRKYLKDDPNISIMNVHGIGFKLVDSSI